MGNPQRSNEILRTEISEEVRERIEELAEELVLLKEEDDCCYTDHGEPVFLRETANRVTEIEAEITRLEESDQLAAPGELEELGQTNFLEG